MPRTEEDDLANDVERIAMAVVENLELDLTKEARKLQAEYGLNFSRADIKWRLKHEIVDLVLAWSEEGRR